MSGWKYAARVAVACLEFLADEIEAGRITPEAAVKAIRLCVAYAKSYMEADTLRAWPHVMSYFKATIWPELLNGKRQNSETERVQ